MTLEQQTLDGTSATLVDGKPLRPRQQLAWDMVRAAPHGVDADEIGAALHHLKGKHHADARCRWCGDDGKRLLSSVALKTLVIRKRATGRWHPRNPKDAAAVHSGSPGTIAVSNNNPLSPFEGL